MRLKLAARVHSQQVVANLFSVEEWLIAQTARIRLSPSEICTEKTSAKDGLKNEATCGYQIRRSPPAFFPRKTDLPDSSLSRRACERKTRVNTLLVRDRSLRCLGLCISCAEFLYFKSSEETFCGDRAGNAAA
ncbi:MAG: hypothetical protein ACREIA_26055 [Opitutaceae bacterium]